MRFLVTVHADKNSRAGLPPNPELMAAIAKIGEEEMKSKRMVLTGGLGYSNPGTRVTANDGQLTVTDGPFTETKELLNGFAIFDVKSKEEILEQTKKFMRVHQEILGPSWQGVCEIHQIFMSE